MAHARPLDRRGAGLAEITKSQCSGTAHSPITSEACDGCFGSGEALPRGLWEGVKAAITQ